MTHDMRSNYQAHNERADLYAKTLRRGRRLKRQRFISRISVIVAVALVASTSVIAISHHETHTKPSTPPAPAQRKKPTPSKAPATSTVPQLVSFRTLQGSSVELSNVDGTPVTGDGATWALVSTPSEIELVGISGSPPAITDHIAIAARSAVSSAAQIAQPVISGHIAYIASTLGLYRVDLASGQVTATLPDHLGTPQSLTTVGGNLWLLGNTLNASKQIVAVLQRIDPSDGSVTQTYQLPGACAGPALIAQGTTLWTETIPCGTSTHAHLIGFSTTKAIFVANYSFPVAHEFQLQGLRGDLLWGSVYRSRLDLAAVRETDGSLTRVLHVPADAVGLGAAPTKDDIWSLGNREAALINPVNNTIVRTIMAPSGTLFVTMELTHSTLWIRDSTGLLKVSVAD
ncbi:hypothetical protein [Ferrimicrobium sp.]|uniref:hypothetical protein n=1 Tax=Ferrimicrobium sp. TaxID=2926050 RepID=UPI0026342AD9|nr:hypothetical protein [Ferrimicrobium sp.]